MAKKQKKSKNQNEPEIQAAAEGSAAAPDAEVESPAAEIPETPAVPAVPDLPPVEMTPPPPPPPSRTAAHKAFDLPPLTVGEEKGESGKGVLQGILERTQKEAEAEAAKLMDSLKIQQDAQRMAREEEDRRKAAEARARVEEERRKRDAALKEYEERQRRKEEAEAAKNRPAVHVTTSIEQQKKSSKLWIVFVAVAVVAVGGGVVGWKLMSGPAPLQFTVDSPIERAAGNAIVSTSMAYGSKTLRLGRAIEPEVLIAGIAPEKYEAAPPAAPVVKKVKGGGGGEKKLIEIRTGIIGGKKVVR